VSHLKCNCGYTIPDITDYLPFKGEVLKDQDREVVFTKLTNEIASFALALQAGKFDEWRGRRPWFGEAADPFSWWKVIAMLMRQYLVPVYECTHCGRLWVQAGLRIGDFVSFVREESGPGVLPSEFWRGVNQPPLDPDPSFTKRCS
jgi:hypothetical protein